MGLSADWPAAVRPLDVGTLVRRVGYAKVPAVRRLMLEKQDAGVFSRTLEPKQLDPCVQLQSKDSRLDWVAGP